MSIPCRVHKHRPTAQHRPFIDESLLNLQELPRQPVASDNIMRSGTEPGISPGGRHIREFYNAGRNSGLEGETSGGR